MEKTLPYLLIFHLSFMLSLQAQVIDPQFGEQGIYQSKLGSAATYTSHIFTWGMDQILITGEVYQEPIYPTSQEYEPPFWASGFDLTGNPVTSFAWHGELYMDVQTRPPIATVDQEKNLLIATHAGHAFQVLRINSEGQPDPTFGEEGQIHVPIHSPWNFGLEHIISKPDGKILVLGHLNNGYSGFALIQLQANGELDISFGKKGQAIFSHQSLFNTTPSGNLIIKLYDMILLPGGEILLSGFKGYQNTGGLILRLDKHGRVDSTFKHHGILIPPFLSFQDVFHTLVLPDTTLLISGRKKITYEYLISKIDLAGKLDISFGDSGSLVLPDPLLSFRGEPEVMKLSPSQKIHLLFTDATSYFCQYTLAGKLDKSFADSGYQSLSHLPSVQYIYDFCYLEDGLIAYLGGRRLRPKWGIWTKNGDPYRPLSDSGYLAIPPTEGGCLPQAMMLDENHQIWTVGAASFIDSVFWTGFHNKAFVQRNHASGPETSPLLSYRAGNLMAMTQGASNRLFVAGYHSGKPLLIAYRPDGSLDKSFGENGLGSMDMPSNAYANSIKHIAILPDEKIVLPGNVPFPGFMRYMPDGKLDTSLQGTGVTNSRYLFPTGASVTASHVYTNGNVLLAGGSYTGFFLSRMNPNGEMDITFGEGGLISQDNKFYPIRILKDKQENITVGGYLNGIFMLQFFLPDGRLNTARGDGGIIRTYFPNGKARLHDMTQMPNGNILMVGMVTDSRTLQIRWAMAQYLPDGRLDSTFGENGLFHLGFEEKDASAHCVAADENGSFFVGGQVAGRMSIIHFIPQLEVDTLISSYWEETIIFPNPIHLEANIRYRLAYGQQVKIILYDLEGRELYCFWEAERPTGIHEEKLVFPEDLKGGWYILEVRGQEGKKTIKIMLQP